VSEWAITLGDVAEHTTVLAVACSRCERAGRYDLDTLIARHGEGFVFRGCCACCPKIV
jgi:hypothetical protein